MGISGLIRDYWPNFKRPIIIVMVIGNILIAGLAGGAFWWFGIIEEHLMLMLAIVAIQLVLNFLLSVIIFKMVVRPTKDILAAITHISGEPTTVTPPNPNEKRFAKNGFKAVLQTLYSLAANRPDAADLSNNSSNNPANIPAETQAQAQNNVGTRPAIEQALDDTICGFITFNESRQITYANKATPVRIDSSGVMSLDILFKEDDNLDTWWDECNERSVRAEKTWARLSNKLPNEEDRRFFDVIASYNKGAANEVTLVLIDRTHLYSIGEEELDFIAFAAHELRGPITVIRGYLDVLQDELVTVLEDEQKELFRRLAVSATRLSGYVNNILNTSRYDRRHLRMHLGETTVSQVYDSIKDDMALRASSQGRLLTVNIPTDLPTIPADGSSLGEVFANIIDNAIKYSNEGGTIKVTAVQQGDLVNVSIEDHGIGMPGNVVGNLFQKFYRSHRSRETVAGTGIGLYISKAIVESHGGTISVKSEEGRGSTFTVSLPTYKSVADKLQSGDNKDVMKKTESGAWIKNHAAFRG